MHFSTSDSALEENQFVQGFLDVEQESWDDFASSWNHLESDRFMADGGKYRFRRYSEFDVVAGTKNFSIRPHVPYSQPKAVNHLNGGIQRHYEAIESSVYSSAYFVEMVHTSMELMKFTKTNLWKLQCFQNRITVDEGHIGLPAPEGRHRDGVDFVFTLLVDRKNADGGVSGIFDPDGSTIATVQLEKPGEFIFLNDKRVMHDVTPIELRKQSSGYRDTLIAMFTANI